MAHKILDFLAIIVFGLVSAIMPSFYGETLTFFFCLIAGFTVYKLLMLDYDENRAKTYVVWLCAITLIAQYGVIFFLQSIQQANQELLTNSSGAVTISTFGTSPLWFPIASIAAILLGAYLAKRLHKSTEQQQKLSIQ